MMTPTSLRQAAELYVSQGFVLVEIPHRSKAPKTKDWQHQGVDSLDKARAIFSHPRNLGLLHSASGTCCLDIDDESAAREVFEAIGLNLDSYLNANTPKIQGAKGIKPVFKMPKGVKLETKKLAWHYTEDNKRKAQTVFELRGAGGQDVLPPSLHPSGITYEWLDGYPESFDDFLELPFELFNLWRKWEFYAPIMQSVSPYFQPPKVDRKTNSETSDIIQRYNQSIDVADLLERNGYKRKGKKFIAPGSSTGLAGVVILESDGKQVVYSHHGSDVLGNGHSHDAFGVTQLLECNGDIKQALDRTRAHLGLPAFEVAKGKPSPKAKEAKKQEAAKRRATLVQLSTVETKEVSWLWHPYIPLGKLTLLEGDPSAGKTFLSLALCASITKGFAFLNQDGSPLRGSDKAPRNVVYMTAEDGLDDTIKPRFDSMGGDSTRLYALTGFSLTDESGKEHSDLAVSLADIDVLREMLEQVSPVLVVIDPIQAFLGAGVDMHRANEVRPLLSGLSKLAEEYHTAFILIRHLGKSTKGKAMYSGLGSIDFAAAARSVLLAGEHNGSKVMAHVKSSLAPTGKSMSYSIGGEPGFTWDGVSSLTAEDIRAFEPEVESKTDKGSLDEATEWLESQLLEGALSAKSLFKYAKSEGISEITLKRAKQKLDVKSRRETKGNKGGGGWLWYLEGHEELAIVSDAKPDDTDTLTDSSLRIQNDTLTKSSKNADRDTTLVTVSRESDDTVTKLPILSSKNEDFVRVSNTTLREESKKEVHELLTSGVDDDLAF